MSGSGGLLARPARAARRLFRVLNRPVRAARGKGGIAVQAFRGYGSQSQVFMIGRVLRQPGGPASGSDLADLGRRILQRGVRDAALTARFNGVEERIATDRDGYFRLHLDLPQAPPAEPLWHPVELTLTSPESLTTEGEVFIPPPDCDFVVISDIDDTIVYTGVANKAKMLWHLFMQDAEDRVAFPGAGAFLQALHRGPSGRGANPMLYVSRGPWSIYEVLDEFFNRHEIPDGPILFLREWGLTLHSPLPRRAKGHKLALIRNMLKLYDTLPFILIGDSGQRDPEIYAQVVHEHPGRVKAIYIRNVSHDAERDEAIHDLGREIAAAGSTLVLTADSLEMAHHAAEHGLIPPRREKDVVEERDESAERSAEGSQGDRSPAD